MAFNFNGNNRPNVPSGNSPRKDIDYTSLNNDSGSFGSSGGFGSRPSGFQDPPSAPSGFQNKPTGFQNRPELRDSPRTDTGIRPGTRNTSTRSTPKAPAKRPAVRRGNGGASIPWRILLPIIGILLAVILIIVFHEAITEFLIQLLAWAILILIVLFLFKRLIFGGKKKD